MKREAVAGDKITVNRLPRQQVAPVAEKRPAQGMKALTTIPS